MQVSRWGNSLAVRLPRELVEQLGLKVGDALTVVAAGEGQVTLARDTRRADALARMRGRALSLPEGWRFDREEANGRDVEDAEGGR
jgi:antitoxin MazE